MKSGVVAVHGLPCMQNESQRQKREREGQRERGEEVEGRLKKLHTARNRDHVRSRSRSSELVVNLDARALHQPERPWVADLVPRQGEVKGKLGAGRGMAIGRVVGVEGWGVRGGG
jgi:hypothetical protein